MGIVNIDHNKRYTHADYQTRLDDKRCELIDGFVHLFPSGELTIHQLVSVNISIQFNHLPITCAIHQFIN